MIVPTLTVNKRVLVFKTSVIKNKEVEALRPVLNESIIGKWNFDLEDCDHILRVESESLSTETVQEVLLKYGYECQSLED